MSSFTEKEKMATHLLKGLLQTQHNADYNEFKKTVSGYTDACFHQDLVDCVTYKIMDALAENDVDICQYNDKCYFYLESEQEIDKMKDVISRIKPNFLWKVATEIDDYDGTYIVKTFFNRYLNVLEFTYFYNVVFGVMADELMTGEKMI